MGKRSKFERRPADFCPTPPAAVQPLLPFLGGIRTFAEPCSGAGDLVRALEKTGLRCAYLGDIRSGNDALARNSYGAIDAIITNPPHSREILHRLMAHFQRIAPTWLLIDADWAQTRQAAPFLLACTDIVSISRVKWIPGSKHTGKDNFAWYRFEAGHTAAPALHWRGADTGDRGRVCAQCGKAYTPLRSSSRFCSGNCRTRACRNRLSVTLALQEGQ